MYSIGDVEVSSNTGEQEHYLGVHETPAGEGLPELDWRYWWTVVGGGVSLAIGRPSEGLLTGPLPRSPHD